MKISILGAGNMGGAIARGLASSTLVSAEDIIVTAQTQKTLDRIQTEVPNIRVSLDNLEAVRDADIIMLTVKPWILPGVVAQIRPAFISEGHSSKKDRRPLIVSIVAGVSFKDLENMFGFNNAPMFRVIPNTAISIKRSPTIIACSDACSSEEVENVKVLFDELGSTFLTDESHMAAATAVTSCGIAYAMQYIKAAMQASVELGLYARDAKRLVCETVSGAAALLEANDTMPDEEIFKVCTPGGITIRGLNEMAAKGFDHAVIAGLKKASL